MFCTVVSPSFTGSFRISSTTIDRISRTERFVTATEWLHDHYKLPTYTVAYLIVQTIRKSPLRPSGTVTFREEKLMLLTVKDIIAIGRTVRTTKTWNRREAWYLLKLTDARLKAAARGELALAADVRLPMEKVIEQLWRVRKIALATWQENVRCDREGLPALERAAQ